jgi:hypothetical protein
MGSYLHVLRRLAMLTAVAVVAGCGGAATLTAVPSPTGMVTPGLTPAPTSTPVPTPPPTPTPSPSLTVQLKSIHDLLNAPHPSVTAQSVVDAMARAFKADPTGGGQDTDVIINGTTPSPNGGYQVGFTRDCAGTQPMEHGMREGNCEQLILILFQAYRHNGLPAFYDAALAVYNYEVHALAGWGTAFTDAHLIKVFGP